MVEPRRYEKSTINLRQNLSIPTQTTHSADSYFAILLKEITALNTSYPPFFNKKAQSIKLGFLMSQGYLHLESATSNSVKTVPFVHLPKPLPQAHHYGNGTHHQVY